jgi:hypothetical protein
MLTQSNKARVRNKSDTHKRGRSEIYLFADDIILYFKDLKDYTRIIFNLIYTSNKVSGYKIDIQKSVAFLYINNKLRIKLG